MCFKTMIGIPDENEKYRAEIVCKDVANGDNTFKYKIVSPGTPDLRKKFSAIIIIYSSSLKIANERGGWFIHKVRDAKVADYFWVKQC